MNQLISSKLTFLFQYDFNLNEIEKRNNMNDELILVGSTLKEKEGRAKNFE
jgi:hypothetical protein